MKLSSVLAVAALGLAANACLLDSEIKAEADYHLHGILPKRQPQLGKRQARRDMPIGQGDRFKGGSVAPHGLGVDDRNLESILNVGEVESALKGLAQAFDGIEMFTAPHSTFENASVHGAIIGDKQPRAFIMSGIHARERGGPDDVIYFIADLLQAHKYNSGIKYGNQSYTHDDVLTALSAGIAIIPLVNPDGVAHDQAASDCWRKNRNTASASKDDETTIGVDLNRNFDFLWDFKKAYNKNNRWWLTASDEPSSEIFHGTAPLSEPETKNVAWVMKTYPDLSWFLDLHSFGGDILYSWGDDDSQTTDPAENFTNPAYDGKRGIVGIDPADSVYKEYIREKDLDAQRSIGERMKSAMSHAGPTPYVARESAELYATSGISTDYALSRYYGHHCGSSKIQGFTLEFGQSSTAGPCPFYPSNEQYHEWMREVSTGLMEFLMNAAKSGDVERWEC
ncbi:Fc.00g011900.m01.CDS01 [Cosmosporella sp. VM-42]